MTRSVTFTVPLPPAALHPNSRAHWRTKANARSAYRRDVYLSVLEQHDPDPNFERARISLLFKTRTAHQHDIDGLISSAKALVDTLCMPAHRTDPTPRLGIIWDDSPRYLTWGDVRAEKALKGERPCVVVTLTETESHHPRPAGMGKGE